jgi:hypothetical protein
MLWIGYNIRKVNAEHTPTYGEPQSCSFMQVPRVGLE